MKWLELAATDFDEALRKSEGVVLIPIGSVEVHGPHVVVAHHHAAVPGHYAEVEQCRHAQVLCLFVQREPAVVVIGGRRADELETGEPLIIVTLDVVGRVCRCLG